MHIGICAPYDLARDGGVNSHIRAQARALQTLGHTARIFGAASAPLPRGEQSVSGCIAPVIGGTETGMGIDPRTWRRVRRLYAEERFDVIHVHEPLMPLVPWCAVLAATAPVVATFHTHREREHRFYARFARLLRPLLRRVTLRVAVSAAARSTVDRYFPGQYLVVPNGISAVEFQRAAPPPPEMSGATRVVLFVGRIEPRKGINDLIDAMSGVADACGSVRLVIVGDGPDRAAAESRARHSRADVRFAGRVADDILPAYYRAADVVCSPAIGDESFGIVLLEALAAGRPVVATDIAGYRELALKGAADLVRLTPAADSRRLAAGIVSSLNDAELSVRARTAGPAFAKRFDWQEIAGRLTAQYAALLAHAS
ncbi:MAG TPA: glycosyltransferase family 4 protein [Vicinamibacterales bacterium]|nr:glycosyltransferase family 4 protein [Vicinamibacterales bacterium]